MAPPRPLEWLRRPTFTGPSRVKISSGAKNWINRTVLASGSAFVTVSTAMVKSNSFWRVAQLPNSVGVGASSGLNVVVNSVVDGVSFALARATGVATAWDETISWEIVRTTGA